MSVIVSAFYKFVAIDDPAALRARLHEALATRDMRGTLLIAVEGINGTVSGSPTAIAEFLAAVRADQRFADLVTKDAAAPSHPFQRLKVKVKPEILSFGHPEADPTLRAGTYVAPEHWNAVVIDPDVVLIDTRKGFEVAAGSFPGAIDPGMTRFSDFPAFVAARLDPARDTKVAMFCTGGIRCEKASAYLRAHGFERVYHLKGGILDYIARVPPAESLWQGECFVFDERGGVSADDD